MQANGSILCIPMAANASPDDSAWQQGKHILSLTRTAHSNYGQPVQQSPLHTGQVEPLLRVLTGQEPGPSPTQQRHNVFLEILWFGINIRYILVYTIYILLYTSLS